MIFHLCSSIYLRKILQYWMALQQHSTVFRMNCKTVQYLWDHFAKTTDSCTTVISDKIKYTEIRCITYHMSVELIVHGTSPNIAQMLCSVVGWYLLTDTSKCIFGIAINYDNVFEITFLKTTSNFPRVWIKGNVSLFHERTVSVTCITLCLTHKQGWF